MSPWAGNPHRPFCSERCRLLDLGNWASERYCIPSPPADGVTPELSDDNDDNDDEA
jgi:uncharacterized protein